MQSENTICIVPVLPCERWTSIDLYRKNLHPVLASVDDHQVAWLEPTWSSTALSWQRRYLRYCGLPFWLNKQYVSHARKGRVAIHLLDHSYGHLVRRDYRTIVTCNDVDHFIVSGISKLARHLWRMKILRLRNAWKIVSVTATLKDQILTYLGVDEDRVIVNPNGIDHHVFHPGSANFDRPLPKDLLAARSRGPLVVHIGKLGPRKNLNTLLNAIGLLRERGIPLSLVRIGESIFSSELESIIKRWNLADSIVDLGMKTQAEVAVILSACDILAFPSIQEGFGRPTLEAQACGLPCVLSDLPVMREVSGGAALFHEPYSEEQIADNLRILIENQDLRKDLIIRGIANAARYSWENHATKLHHIYSSALEGH